MGFMDYIQRGVMKLEGALEPVTRKRIPAFFNKLTPESVKLNRQAFVVVSGKTRLKLLMLITLCILLIRWATSTYLVDTLHETPAAKGMVGSFRKPTIIKKEQKENSEMKALLTEKLPTASPLCPSVSPYLRGPSKLTFKTSLTLEELRKQNPLVAKGRHRPKDCTAQQRVAILIPHRNREKHLLYLLENLHPFLQRQQLDYGLYVIHQAGNAKFNRAKLLNVGYLEALKEENWDCFIFHDVDLVPENDFNIYVCGSQPKHLVVGRNSTGYRMNLLHQVPRVWKTDGLNSCSYKLLSKEYNPLYTNITVDFGRQTKFS
ncbi:beta-C4-galactosyltransferase 4 [Crotalus adamanteus]|uniref:Beta-1,4-galactosyltransferase n=1 Tax=Crotalus adamanteus TaxID=8729 RepID=A0AAW1BKR7_CROAD